MIDDTEEAHLFRSFDEFLSYLVDAIIEIGEGDGWDGAVEIFGLFDRHFEIGEIEKVSSSDIKMYIVSQQAEGLRIYREELTGLLSDLANDMIRRLSST